MLAKNIETKDNNIVWALKYAHIKLNYQMSRGVLLPGAPKPRYLINKLIKQQEQIYHLQL